MIDLATKMVVGWQLGNRANAQLCIEALEMAHRNGHVQPDAIFHSDRGCQYSSGTFNRCTQPPRGPSVDGTNRRLLGQRPGRNVLRLAQGRMRLPHRDPEPRARPPHRSAATSKSSTTDAADTRRSTTRHPNSDTHSSPTSRRKLPEDDRPKFGTQPKDDVRFYVDADQLVELWDELVLPPSVRKAWEDWFRRHRLGE